MGIIFLIIIAIVVIVVVSISSSSNQGRGYYAPVYYDIEDFDDDYEDVRYERAEMQARELPVLHILTHTKWIRHR